MATGDDALSVGYTIVPETDQVKKGADEINRTRDLIAQLLKSIPTIWPLARGGTGASTSAGARENLGFRSGTADPTGGAAGDVYFKIL